MLEQEQAKEEATNLEVLALDAKITLGQLTSNAKSLQKAIKTKLSTYKAENYSIDNYDEAKKDKATINKLSKTLNDRRIELEREYNKPFEEFKATINEIVADCKTASNAIDQVVKEVDEKWLSARKLTINEIWKSLDFTLASLTQIYDEKWENKGTSEKKIKEAMEAKIQAVKADLEALNTLTYHSDEKLEIKANYFGKANLSLSLALSMFRERQEELKRTKELETNTVQEVEVVEPVKAVDSTPVTSEPEEMITAVLELTGTRSKMQLLALFIKQNGINYKKIKEEK